MSAAQVVHVILLFWILRPLLAILQFFQKIVQRIKVVLYKRSFLHRRPRHLAIAFDSGDKTKLEKVMQWCTHVEKISVFDRFGELRLEDCNVISGKDSRFKVAQWIKEIPEKELQPASFVMEKLNGMLIFCFVLFFKKNGN